MKEQISIRLDKGLLRQLRAKAKKENRSLSNLMEVWLKKAVEAQP